MACKVSAALRLGFVGFFCLPELLDQSGPLLRWGFGDGRNGLLCGLDATGKDFLLDAWSNFFCSVYTLSKIFRPSHKALAYMVFIGDPLPSFFFFDQVVILTT